ncbi:MAG: SEC-C metal-binding domain-containing protein [Rhodopirellula sp. JB053]
MADRIAKDQAERQADGMVAEAVEENLPSGMEDEWNWKAMATWANTRLQTNYQDHKLKQLDRDEMVDEFEKKAYELIEQTDLSEGEPLLEADYGLRVLCGWMRHKFGIETTPEEFRDIEDPREVAETLMKRAEASYADKEAEYPVLTGISKYTEKNGSQVQLDRESLIGWVEARFGKQLSVDDIKLNREELKQQLVQYSKTSATQSTSVQETGLAKVSEIFKGADDETTALLASGDSGQLEGLVQWLSTELDHETSVDDLARMNRDELTLTVEGAVDDRFYPEMRRMERQILLNIVDDAWKNHLLTMDHLRSSVGLKGYAQMDPKVEYKREGMRLFETMWGAIGERVSDLIFRMESFNEEFIRSTWVDARARHDDAHEAGASARMASDTAAQRAASGSEGHGDGEEVKPEPIRKDEPRIGRNAPCPCGSGKKYKSCCMRKMA